MKLVAVLFFLGAGATYVKPENWTPFAPYGWPGIMAAAAVVFFAYIGLSFSVHAFSQPGMVLGVLLVSIATKILGGYLGGRILKMSQLEALGAGIILNGRGIMELVVANIAYQKELIDQDLFSTLIIMGIVTTVITPMLFAKTKLGSISRARV